MAMDTQDYWSGTGYSQMPDSKEMEGYRPFDASKALGQDYSTPDFGYAPWAGGPTTGWDSFEMDPYAGGQAPTGNTGGYKALSEAGAAGNAGYGAAGGMGAAAGAYGGLGFASGGIGGMAGLMSSGILGPAGLAGAGIGYMSSMIGKKKKRGTPGLDSTDTPYQGFQFEPAEGFPAYYETAQGSESPGQMMQDPGFQYQQPQQQGYDYNYTGGTQPNTGAFAPSSQQSYVGQQEQEYGSFYNRDKGGIYDTFTV